MPEITVTRRRNDSLGTIFLNGKRVLLNYKWVVNYNEEKHEVGNLNKNSNSRSIVTLEIKRDHPAIPIPLVERYTEEDTDGLKEWEKLNKSEAKTPGGQPLAFEDGEGRKFIVLTETFNGSDGSTQTTFDKKYFNSLENEELTGSSFDPSIIENWERVLLELSLHKNGKPSVLGKELDKSIITEIDSKTKKSDGIVETPDISASGLGNLTGIKGGTAPALTRPDPPEEEETPQEVDQQDPPPVPHQTIKDSEKFELKQDLYYPIDVDVKNTDYLLIKIVEYKPAGGSQGNYIRSQGNFPNDLTGGVFSGTQDNPLTENFFDSLQKTVPGQGDFKYNPSGIDFGATSRNKNDIVKIFPRSKRDLQNLIFLPMPSNIQDGNSVSFGDNSLDALSAGLAGVAELSIQSVTDFVSGKLDENSQIFKDISAQFDNISPTLQKRLQTMLLAQAANLSGVSNVSFQSLLARESGSILNPNKELLFNGVSLRTFRFSFKFTPRSQEEGIEVRRIIRRLKQNMAPKIGKLDGSNFSSTTNKSGHFLKTPNVFELQYMNGTRPHPFLNYFKTCALTDMSMKYTGENTYSTYHDGTPTSMIMDLTFKELEPIYSQDYDLPGNGAANPTSGEHNKDQVSQTVGY